jgi:hypothetical protein
MAGSHPAKVTGGADYGDHEVTITAPLQAEHELKLFDLLGRLLGEFTVRNGACVLDVKDYTPGTYVFRIEQSSYSGKILVGP